MQVSNQREYSAVLNEIDTTKGRFSEIERAIGLHDSEIEELAGPASEADERIGVEQEKLDAEKGALESELSTVSSRLAELSSQSEEIRGSTSQEFLVRFSRIFEARGGIAVAAIENGACGACHLRLRPQVISLCRRGEELNICENCGRILYVDDAPPEPKEAETAPPTEQDDSSGHGGAHTTEAPSGRPTAEA